MEEKKVRTEDEIAQEVYGGIQGKGCAGEGERATQRGDYFTEGSHQGRVAA